VRTCVALALLGLPGFCGAGDKLILSEEEKGVLDLTNAERKAAGLPPLAPNAKLFKAAREHAANMAKQDKLDHVLDEKDLGDRMKAAGYQFLVAGENIAWNQADPKAALQTWMGSEGHRANILNVEYAEIGVAVVKNARGERYWTQVFGKAFR
jgi:uncharacterized protein YkwD